MAKLARRALLTVVLLTLAAGVLIVAFYILHASSFFDPIDRGHDMVRSEYIGRTKASILEQYGPPTQESSGYYVPRNVQYTKQHEPAVSMTYVRARGVLYLAFEQKGDYWVCFSSTWMPNGMEF
jgi:hypothetical protein